jgi:uncharacterized protein YjbI with pentapeptide repeats
LGHDFARSDIGVLEPRVPAELVETRHSALRSHDEWQNEALVADDLSGQQADHVEVSGCTLRGVRMTGARLEQLRLVDVLAFDCELSGALLTEASLRRVEFRNCRMSGVVIADTKLRDVRFRDCKLDDTNFRFVKAEKVVLDDCSLVATDFTEASSGASAFWSCDLRRAVFTKASMAGTRFAGSMLEELTGASALREVIVGTDQVLPLALGVFGDLGIVISDETP